MRLALLFFLAVSLNVFAAPKIETIQLNQRLATDVLPEVQAFLPNDATARAYNELIIIKAEPAVIEQIKQLIHKLDTPAQSLIIEVLKTSLTIRELDKTELSGHISVGDENSAALKLRTWSTRKNNDQNQHYQAQGIAGRPVAIHMGSEIPQQQQLIFLRENGDIAVQSSTEYLDISSGFQAVASILPNNQASIEIYPLFSRLTTSGTIERSSMMSSISGAAGKWLLLGQINNQKNIDHYSTNSYHSHKQQSHYIYLKIDHIISK